jgi:thiamine-phosphate pyrophosphorylase
MIDFRLCFVTDGTATDVVARACAAGLRAVQFRNKTALGKAAWETARRLREITAASGARLLVNERADVARAVGAEGVHCPEEGLPADAARHVMSAGAWVGASSHSVDAARRAVAEGADYVFFGPVFDTPSKAVFGKPLGLAALRDVCDDIDIPVFAIGGVTPDNARACINHGAHGLAVISAIAGAPDVDAAVGSFREVIGTL